MTTNESLQSLQATMRGLFPELLGIRLTEATPERVAAEMPGRDELCTLPGTIHGGALMALADTVGAYATAINLPQGAGTTTIESKTNFFARATPGKPIRAVATPLHRGRTTMVWQTRVECEERLCALVTQTQAVLPKRQSPAEQLASLFAEKTPREQQALLAELERGGAAVYRALAEAESNAEARRALLAAAEREEENAAAMEKLTGR